jgi:mevalonate kinase
MHNHSDQQPIFETRAKGKLLLSGEYFVLDGAWALALPVRFGQALHVEADKEPNRLFWTSRNHEGNPWFLAEFECGSLDLVSATDARVGENLRNILRACRRQNPQFLPAGQGFKALIHTDFPGAWGLGTSSTLIAALAAWAGADPYQLLFDTMGGSGYDIACAYAEGPILYRLAQQKPEVRPVAFQPAFAEQLFFVYLGKKQDSREGIRRYRERAPALGETLRQVSDLAQAMLQAPDLQAFEGLLRLHEQHVGAALELPLVQAQYFPDYWGAVKSLGAWGGDFVLATSAKSHGETRQYFHDKGFDTVLGWGEMVRR